MTAPEPQHIVIIGGGIIGCCTAYFLSRHPLYHPSTHSITLIEATTIAGGASGKAGGLLAKWAYPSCLVPLSFRLHARLAEEHAGAQRWGYRLVECGQLGATARTLATSRPSSTASGQGPAESLGKRLGLDKTLKAAGLPEGLQWVAPDAVTSYEEMSKTGDTAQVHPELFTRSMAVLAKERGVNIVYGQAKSVGKTDGRVQSVTYTDKETKEEKIVSADTVVLTAGPWTQNLYSAAPIVGLRAHSVVVRPSKPLSSHALFTQIHLPAGFSRLKRAQLVTPEIYCRPDNTAYACGPGDQLVPLPSTSDDVQIDQSRCQDVIDQIGAISDELRDGEVLVRQACYLPVSEAGGGPFIGETSVKGLIIAAGHTCWGIQNAPGTGLCVSELVLDGKVKSANIQSLDPTKAGM
ncbi:fad NAD binding oxidoreductase [Eremomyces bilateralis CBS 781.70]|uniref:Fad NAD binding oxidoreductase n=1 Tax=Eremomyces bilateralis CBS 781.70 TaxID=1392243 RepID=A0A6G1G9K2_9PEZI|nr:fad NAD binding oxidoreductase [Eremomyces bilateralis CBS 781.70]KAF1814581.1 fad NAD binding oxidoreductase [Eremomyces bilateralis CBS 781.70]